MYKDYQGMQLHKFDTTLLETKQKPENHKNQKT